MNQALERALLVPKLAQVALFLNRVAVHEEVDAGGETIMHGAEDLDTLDERRVWIVHNDVLWAQFLEYAVVVVACVRAHNDKLLVRKQTKAVGKERLVKVVDHLVVVDHTRAVDWLTVQHCICCAPILGVFLELVNAVRRGKRQSLHRE